MRFCLVVAALMMFLSSCNSQTAKQATPVLLGTCEGCEAVFEYGNKKLSGVDTLPDFHDQGKKLLVTGTIYKPDGRTPAPGVVLYVYHTNQQGIYEPRGNETGWAKRNGYIRGWIKTGDDGKYSFYTLVPGIYPSRNAPAHIHPILLEPDGKYYWLNSFLFQGDSLITRRDLDPEMLRGGGTGVMKLELQDGIWVGKRDIILGKNVPGYK